jgi:hypothetical protein
MAGVLGGELVDGGLEAVDESLGGLGQVGAAGRSGVVAVAGSRWARVEYLSEVKLWASSSEPMTWPSLRMRLPAALRGNRTPAMPVTSSG